ncbi:MoaF-related domain-containing protein [Cellulosimicrobium cellulans]|uniref:MoaF-related domain-containing protein n=1 Tax=Cellulosimicrobium cellulans TaxID=1710 RepID=UPI0002D432AF|nr:MoaF N-terminal domain-containing protein [Cellulosimicrobium cellulans]
MDSNATLPSVGQTWLADLGPDTPLGHFTVEITFETETRVSFHVTGGAIKGRTETMDYTTTQVRDGLYVVRWTEPDSNDHVTHIEDYTNGACMASSVIGGEFVQLHGTWTRVR